MAWYTLENLINDENVIILGDIGKNSKNTRFITMRSQKLTKETILNIGTGDREFPRFNVGDTVEVSLIVKEGSKERIQKFAGDIISDHNNGISSTFTVRKIGANNIGVEKTFPYYSPTIEKIKVVKRGKVKRSKLYYLRDRVGKAARIKEKIERKVKKKAVKKKVVKKVTKPKVKKEAKEPAKKVVKKKEDTKE